MRCCRCRASRSARAAAQHQELGRATTCCSSSCEPGTVAARRVHAEPLLRGAGARCVATTSPPSASALAVRARRQRRQRERRHGRSEVSPTRAQTCAAVATLLGCATGAGAAVLDRRHHGAAAGRADRRRRCPRAARPLATTAGSPRRGDHDDRHGAEGRVAPVASTASPSPSPGIAKGAGMIHPDMATMLAFVATDAPVAPRAARGDSRARSPTSSFNGATVDGDTSTNDSFVDRRHRQAAHRADASRADDPRLAGAARRASRRRRRARAGDRPRRRGRDQVHRRFASKAAATPANAARVAFGDRALAAGQDRVLRVGSRTSAASSARSATPVRATSIPRACRSGSTTCSSSTAAGARPRYREEDGQRVMKQDEITRPRRPRPRPTRAATVWTCDFSHDYVIDQRRLPVLTDGRSCAQERDRARRARTREIGEN